MQLMVKCLECGKKFKYKENSKTKADLDGCTCKNKLILSKVTGLSGRQYITIEASDLKKVETVIIEPQKDNIPE